MKKGIRETLAATAAHLFPGLSDEERRRLGAHGVAIGMVAAATLAKSLFGLPSGAAAFLLLQAAVAAAALTGGASPASVAALFGILVARIAYGASFAASLLFAIESILVAALVVRVSGQLRQHQAWLDSSDRALRQLRASDRRTRVVAAAFNRLQEATHEYVVALLDAEGKVSEWTRGAERLYAASPAEALGGSARSLFYPELDETAYAALLSTARASGSASCRRTHQRADGTVFEADVEFSAIAAPGASGFTMLVHDLTGRQAAEAFARNAAERQVELREEITVAQQQLASLETVTDPHLNALNGRDAVTTLLERLRAAVTADGVAIVRLGSVKSRLLWATDGLVPDAPAHGSRAEHAIGRTLMIHNDEMRVAEMSAARWPGDVRSLIAVPVLLGGHVHATMEVVYVRGRRSTDWEIALIQVAAARAASLLPEDSYAGTGAVA